MNFLDNKNIFLSVLIGSIFFIIFTFGSCEISKVKAEESITAAKILGMLVKNVKLKL
jgi:hypothetical protein